MAILLGLIIGLAYIQKRKNKRKKQAEQQTLKATRQKSMKHKHITQGQCVI